ncbi:MAG: tetratricopeptide repeat protein [Treponema sp.]|jgi:tetratricopeptide (TPR) repeat protein|nr:tetratricopeptide repeat protein [Treponema sp.]
MNGVIFKVAGKIINFYGKTGRVFIIFSLIFLSSLFCACAGLAADAQEYYSIGMAYYGLGKYEEAEKWLNRAKQADRTMTASQYNLGRIAFETKKYEEAAKHFEGILKKDPDNILALRAAAYTRIKMGDIEKAEKHYSRLLALVPESADDGYNHALVLFAMERYEKAEEVMEKYPFSLEDNNDLILLYARTQKALNKVEAIDSYAKWLNGNSDKKIRYEYAQLLEKHELYARALEEYRSALSDFTPADDSASTSTAVDTGEDIKKSDVRFSLARLLLTADASSGEGVTEMENAVSEGYDNIEEVEKLQKNTKVSAVNRDKLRSIVNNMQKTAEAKEKEAAKKESEKNLQQDASETNLEGGSQ